MKDLAMTRALTSSPSSRSRTARFGTGLATLLAACSGGSSTPTAPIMRNLVLTPDAVYVSATPVQFTAAFEFTDPDGDLASAHLVITDSHGAQTANQVIPILQANGVTSAQVAGGATATLTVPGTFTAHLTLTDRAGLVSNELTDDVDVHRFPWTTVATNPQPTVNPAVVALGNHVYVLGGEQMGTFSQGPASDRVTAYDPSLDAWAALPALPTRRIAIAAATSGGRIYAIGGATTNPVFPIGLATNVVEEFDPQTQAWRARAPMPTARAHAAAAELGGRIIVAGGDLDGGYSAAQMVATVESYDPTTDAWTTLPSLPQPRSGLRAAVFVGRLLVGGGPFQTTSMTPELYAYDPVANEWSVLPLPGRFDTALVSDGGALWTLSGSVLHGTDDPAGGVNAWRTLTDGHISVPRGVGAYLGGRIIVLNETTTLRYEVADEIR
jgi:N-acetylneuraminic acid mutarotase